MLKYITVDLNKIKSNVAKVKKILSKEVGLMAIVKSDAYGQGAVEVSKKIEGQVEFLAVDNLAEAFELRKKDIKQPILVLGAWQKRSLKKAADNSISLPIYNQSSLKNCLEFENKLKVHLKIDSGMHRLGVKPKEGVKYARQINKKSNLVLEGVWSHFADSGNPKKDDYSQRQIKRFKKVKRGLDRAGIRPEYYHMSNSSAILRFKSAHFNLVRSGLLLYGYLPTLADLNLEPALEFKTKIVQIKQLKKGQFLGYGLTFRAKKKRKIAVLPVGYKDGYARHLSNKGKVLISGKRCPIVGRICMRMMMVDITGVKAKVGDEVVLIGSQGSAKIEASQLAEMIDSIPYEILSRLDGNIKREYIGR